MRELDCVADYLDNAGDVQIGRQHESGRTADSRGKRRKEGHVRERVRVSSNVSTIDHGCVLLVGETDKSDVERLREREGEGERKNVK